MMNANELSQKLRQMASETGSLNCLGCSEENNCGIHGCAILKAAANEITNLLFRAEETDALCIALEKSACALFPLYRDRLDKIEKKLEAAIADLRHIDNCDICYWKDKAPLSCDWECETCKLACRCRTCRNEDKWMWRGAMEDTHDE